MRTFPIIKDTEPIVVDLTSNRTCGDCTACCTYTLRTVLDRKYNFGEKCIYLTTGCSIYESRPLDPCKLFACSWLHSPHMIPDWLKPNLSNVILVNRKGYLAAIICDASKDYEKALVWLKQFSQQKMCNITISIDGHVTMAYGDEKWVNNFLGNVQNEQDGKKI